MMETITFTEPVTPCASMTVSPYPEAHNFFLVKTLLFLYDDTVMNVSN